jgi:hypothetical protein
MAESWGGGGIATAGVAMAEAMVARTTKKVFIVKIWFEAESWCDCNFAGAIVSMRRSGE